jgi:hypothetical protein
MMAIIITVGPDDTDLRGAGQIGDFHPSVTTTNLRRASHSAALRHAA